MYGKKIINCTICYV